MKLKTLTVLCAVLSCATFTYAENPVIKRTNVEKYFYEKGVKDGQKIGRKSGYADAKRDLLKKLKRYKKRIEAYEAAKYFSKKHKITEPRIYQTRNDDGSLNVVIKGCTIEKELTPDDILSLPSYDGGDIGGAVQTRRVKHNNTPFVNTASSTPSNSVFLPGVDKKRPQPIATRDLVRSTFKIFPDEEFYRKVFREAGLPFAVVAGNKIKVRFSSEAEAASFADAYGFEPGSDIQ